MTAAHDAWVTVYVPTRNRPALLARAVRSVLAQTYPRIEVIIALDRPDRATGEAAAQLEAQAREGRRVRSVESPGAGASAARNAAIAAATGSCITGLDDDDCMDADHVAKLMAAFDPARHAFVFTGFRLLCDAGGGKPREIAVPPRAQSVSLQALLRKNAVGNQALSLTARFREVGGFDESLPAWQDHDMWLRLVKRFGAAASVPGTSYLCDQLSAGERISSDPKRIDAALECFRQKHPEYADRRLAACLALGRARYGRRPLTLREALLVGAASGASRLFAEALLVYAGWLRPKC